jgi:nitrogen fixation NifU-like protein
MGNRYSETIMEHFLEPRNRGQLEHPSGVGLSGTPGQGPYFVLQIVHDGQHIQAAKFQCHNCGVTVACGSVLTEMVVNKPIGECQQITQQQLAEALDGVPSDKLHMLSFAIEALKSALREPV